MAKTIQLGVHHSGQPGEQLKAETMDEGNDVEIMKEHFLLSCSPCLAQPYQE